MSYLRHIRNLNSYDLANFRRFVVAGQRVGWVKHGFAQRLAAFPKVFSVRDDSVALSDDLVTTEDRSKAVNEVIAVLVEEGTLRKLRGEQFDVGTGWGKPALLRIDRIAVAHFGVRAYGVHVNGFTRGPEGLQMWVGRRASDKMVAPGKLDSMVGGGQPSGLGLRDNVIKESEEEAALPEEIARQAKPVGVITYAFENDEGMKRDTLFGYDLELPPGLSPQVNDDEVVDFMLMPIARVAEIVRETDDFKFNVNLVVIDFLIRHGILSPEDEPDYVDIVTGLRSALPGAP